MAFWGLFSRIGRASSNTVSSGLSRAGSVLSMNQDIISMASSIEQSAQVGSAVAPQAGTAVTLGKKALKYGTIGLVGHEIGETVDHVFNDNGNYLSLDQAIKLVNSHKTTPQTGTVWVDRYGCANSTLGQYVDCVMQAKSVELISIFAIILIMLLAIAGFVFMLYNKKGCFKAANITATAHVNQAGITLKTRSNVVAENKCEEAESWS